MKILVNTFKAWHNAGTGSFRSPKNKPATLTGRGLFRVLEVAMQPEQKQFTKLQERAAMAELKERREAQSPEHKSPDWLTQYWKQVAAS